MFWIFYLDKKRYLCSKLQFHIRIYELSIIFLHRLPIPHDTSITYRIFEDIELALEIISYS